MCIYCQYDVAPGGTPCEARHVAVADCNSDRQSGCRPATRISLEPVAVGNHTVNSYYVEGVWSREFLKKGEKHRTERAKAAIDGSRNGSSGSAIMAHSLAAANSTKAVGGQQSGGKVNPDEVLIEVVIKNKPKMLTGLNQKVSGQVRGLRIPPSRMVHHRPRGTTLPPGRSRR